LNVQFAFALISSKWLPDWKGYDASPSF